MDCRTIDDVVEEIGRKAPFSAPPLHRARAIYDWEVAHIAYDEERLHSWFGPDVLHPEETLRRGRGICTDMASLYVAIARRMGLRAWYAHVDANGKGELVNHACAAVDLPERRLLVDPAYGIFDARHRKYYPVEPDVLRETVPCYGPPPEEHCAPCLPHYREPRCEQPFVESYGHRLRMAVLGTALILGAAYAFTRDDWMVNKKCADARHEGGGRVVHREKLRIEYEAECCR